MSKLYGQAHKKNIEKIIELFNEVCVESSKSKFILLEGESGVGKSRIIREVYNKLRKLRNDEYWPEVVEEKVDESTRYSDPFAGRKIVGPSSQGFVWNADVLPTFGWWQFNCDRTSYDGTIDSVAQAKALSEAHLLPLSLAVADRKKPSDKIKEKLNELPKYLRGQSLNILLDVGSICFMLPPLGFLTQAIKDVFGHLDNMQKRDDLLRTDVSIESRVEQIRYVNSGMVSEVICAASSIEIPSVIVIEDMHLMDDNLLYFIQSCLKKNNHILIIGTSWPEYRKESTYGIWRDKENIDVIKVQSPDAIELIPLVQEYAPCTSNDVALRVASKMCNPLLLKLELSSQAIQRSIKSNSDAFPFDKIKELGVGALAVYERRFKEFPIHVQQYLGYCSAMISGIPDDKLILQKIDLVNVAIEALFEQGFDEFQLLSEADMKRVSWLDTDDGVFCFREPVMSSVSYQYAIRKRYFLEEDIAGIVETTSQQLQNYILKISDGYILPRDSLSFLLANWLLLISSNDDTPAHRSAYFFFAESFEESFEYSKAYELARRGLRSSEKLLHDERIIDMYFYLSLMAGKSGDAKTAMKILYWLRENSRAISAYSDLNIQCSLLGYLAELGEVKEARKGYNYLYSICKKELGLADYLTLQVLDNMAFWTARDGEFTLAKDFYEELANLQKSMGIPYYRAYASSLLMVAEMHDPSMVLEKYQHLINEVLAVRVGNDYETLFLRTNFADILYSANQYQRAICELETIYPLALSIMPPWHDAAISMRHMLIKLYIDTRNFSKAEFLVQDNFRRYSSLLSRGDERIFDSIQEVQALEEIQENDVRSIPMVTSEGIILMRGKVLSDEDFKTD